MATHYRQAISRAFRSVADALAVTSPGVAVVSVEKTRPADVTAYVANEVVSEATANATVWSFANIARVNGGSGYVVKGRVVTNLLTGQTQRLRLYLFNAAPTGNLNDNAANTEPKYADIAKMVGFVDFDALDNTQAGADSSENQRDDLRLSFTCGAASRTLSGILVTLDAFTPASGQKFTIILEVEQTT